MVNFDIGLFNMDVSVDEIFLVIKCVLEFFYFLVRGNIEGCYFECVKREKMF